MSKIAWTGATWNPWVGCTRVSKECTLCYAEQEAGRLARMGQAAYVGVTRSAPIKGFLWTGVINRNSDTAFNKPMKRQKPELYFVDSMSDFFHAGVAPEWIQAALKIMVETPRHTYQILTKRPERIREVMELLGITEWPDNVWLGVSVGYAETKSRIDILRAIPARVRFLSLEPLIGDLGSLDLAGIQWAISGGESKPVLSTKSARPCDPDWVRSIRDQCVAAGVPLFHKQWGQCSNNPLAKDCPEGEPLNQFIARTDQYGGEHGGAWLDGGYWRQYPEAAPGVDPGAVVTPAGLRPATGRALVPVVFQEDPPTPTLKELTSDAAALAERVEQLCTLAAEHDLDEQRSHASLRKVLAACAGLYADVRDKRVDEKLFDQVCGERGIRIDRPAQVKDRLALLCVKIAFNPLGKRDHRTKHRHYAKAVVQAASQMIAPQVEMAVAAEEYLGRPGGLDRAVQDYRRDHGPNLGKVEKKQIEKDLDGWISDLVGAADIDLPDVVSPTGKEQDGDNVLLLTQVGSNRATRLTGLSLGLIRRTLKANRKTRR